MNLNRFIKKLRKSLDLISLKAKLSYSQTGEDIIVLNLFKNLNIEFPSYIDIGSNHPQIGNNTYLFYCNKSKGICVEPNNELYKLSKQKRPNDILLNMGIGVSNITEANYYIFPKYAHGLNTFSKDDALYWQEIGQKETGKIPIEKTVLMPLININDLILKHFNNKAPNYLSLDVEGLDLEVLKSLNFEKYMPDVFCVETLQYDENKKEFKNDEIINFMKSKNYFVYADTWVNTIFVRKELF